jgi:hypothetical protein
VARQSGLVVEGDGAWQLQKKKKNEQKGVNVVGGCSCPFIYDAVFSLSV